MKRSKGWREDLAKNLREDREYCRLFLMSLIDEEDYEPATAILKVVQMIGVKEYAEMAHLDSGNLLKQLKGNPTVNTLNKVLSPLEMKISVKVA